MAVNDLSGIGGSGSGGITSGIGGTGILLSDVGDAEKVEYITLNLTAITNKEVALSQAPHAGGKVKIDIIEGLSGHFGVDFTVSGNLIQWGTYALDGLLSVGDTLRVVYLTS